MCRENSFNSLLNHVCVSAACRILIVALCVLTATVSNAQVRCANTSTSKVFEQWMQQKITTLKKRDNTGSRTSAVFQIPVVVHIIHNGEGVGVGPNISDAQVASQIRVLNEDYQRKNLDAVNTPAEFAGVAAGIDLQFVLAKQDPDGLPTTGITRTQAPRTSYNLPLDNVELKALNYWPAEDYLNIWVVNLGGTLLGYAQYPETTLQGADPPYDRLTDGVAIHYRAFGAKADGAFDLFAKYDKGRTTTHEVGHFLSLLHIFGDGGNCFTTDFVNDTPIQKDETLICPSGPVDQCDHHAMFQNYLDFTDDACMNLFTAGQIERVTTVLQNSPRRASLLTSHGLNAPVQLTLDLEALDVASPLSVTCGQSVTPKVIVRNRGTTAVTTARVSFIVNGGTVETKDFNVNLMQLQTATLSFNPVNLAEPSTSNITFTIQQINGGADNDAANNSTTLAAQVLARINPPYIESFNTIPSSWQIVNPDKSITWENRNAPKTSTLNRAMYINLYDYENEGAKDVLISPFFNIPNTDALLKFDRAYAQFKNVTGESLRILVSTGCSTDLSQAVEIYKKTGSDLATTNKQDVPFVPSGDSQWLADGVSLNAFQGKTVRFIFESTNNHGNNIYLDNVQVNTGDLNDVKLTSVVSPGPVICNPRPTPVISVQNLGTKIVNRLTITTEVNGSVSASQTKSGLNMTPGTLTTLTLEHIEFHQASNNVKITISNPDVVADDTPANNSVTLTRMYNTAKDEIPLRQNFDDGAANWILFGEGDDLKWQGIKTATFNNGLVYKAFSQGVAGDESWLVSPVLDMTKLSEGSLFFTTSHGRNPGATERLRVLVSEDCGETFDHVIFDKAGEQLSNETYAADWAPQDEFDWRTEYVSLNDFAGKDNIRFAFVATSDRGNNIYLDNIEFFIEDDPNPPRIDEGVMSVYNSETNPYEFHLTFNLPSRQDGRLLVYNTLGQMMVDTELPQLLNQTYTVNLYGQSTGIYVARLETPQQTLTVKLFVGR